MVTAFSEMLKRHATLGRVVWFGVRSERKAPVQMPDNVAITLDGLVGDHAKRGKRAVTLIQAEHLPVIAGFAGLDSVKPEQLRRNLVVERINLAALRKAHVQIGDVILNVTGPCPPCSRMEAELGFGGYNAMRGHGGWYAEVVRPGNIRIGDTVVRVDDPAP